MARPSQLSRFLALNATGNFPETVKLLEYLVDENNDYENYRKLFSKRSGFPFILPHVQQLSGKDSHTQSQVLQDMFRYIVS